jgi:hypothetical protein
MLGLEGGGREGGRRRMDRQRRKELEACGREDEE